MANQYAYLITLTADEYRSAVVMSDRGYLGMIVEHATAEEWSDDEATVTLQFRESDAWKVQETCEDDPHAVWALTTPRTSLGEKFARFIDSIV